MRGHPVRGAIAGLFFGIALAMDLHILKVWPLSTASEIALPALGLLLGVLLGATAPFGKGRTKAAAPTTESAWPAEGPVP